MTYRILGLDPTPYLPLFGAPDETLTAQGIVRMRADALNAYPDRIEVRDAAIGESVLLINHLYLDVPGPYRGRHAIFVREGATERCDVRNEVPHALSIRLLSLRGFDRSGMMIDADVIDGRAVEELIDKLFSDARVAFIHVHHARRGCYAARIDRA